MSELSDKELLDLFRREESRHYAFNLLVRQFQRPLYTFIRRMVTDHDETKDVLQNVFIKAWKGLDHFRGDSALYSWLYRIAHNESMTHLKKMRRGLFVTNDLVMERLTTTLDSSEHFNGDAIERKLQRAIMRLPTKQRAVFNMKYFDGIKYEDMSRMTGTSVGALKASYHIAVKKIEAWVTQPIKPPAVPEVEQARTMSTHDEHDDLKRLAPTLFGLEKRDPFTVPDGFFERFPHEVQAAIAAKESRKGWASLPLPVRRLAIALPVAALLVGAWWFLGNAEGPVKAELSSTPSLEELNWTEEHDLLASLKEEDLPSLGEATVELTDEELTAYIEHQDIDLTELITEQ